jgi:hypothetical protein
MQRPLRPCGIFNSWRSRCWLTANIGHHHIHRLNARIPFYRLPEAMQAIPELQTPGTSTLKPSDILARLRLKLWDPDSQQLVPWSHLRNTTCHGSGGLRPATKLCKTSEWSRQRGIVVQPRGDGGKRIRHLRE